MTNMQPERAKRGPGKYPGVAEEVLKRTEAEAVLVLVIGGKHGNGAPMAVNALKISEAQSKIRLAGVMRVMADVIEAEGRK